MHPHAASNFDKKISEWCYAEVRKNVYIHEWFAYVCFHSDVDFGVTTHLRVYELLKGLRARPVLGSVVEG